MKNQLSVEGWIDESIVRSIIHLNQSLPKIEIKDYSGVDNLVSDITNTLKSEDIFALGIVVDANDNPTERWDMISDRVRRAGIQLPGSPDPGGVVTGSIPKVGIWLMPDNQSCGEIEDFVTGLIPDKDPVWPRSETYIDNIPEGHRKFSPAKISKAKTYAWVSARKRPGLIGASVNPDDLDLNKELYKRFVHWLEELYR